MTLHTDYTTRTRKLQQMIQEAALDTFLVTSRDSIYYLTGLTYEPLERPFFMLISAEGEIRFLAPHMEHVHIQTALKVSEVETYWEYPALADRSWFKKLNEMLTSVVKVGVEPNIPYEIVNQLSQVTTVISPLIEKMRLVKSSVELDKLRQAALFAQKGMKAILGASYYGVTEIELFSQARSLQLEAIKTTDFDALNSSFLTVSWPARLAEQPHGIPDVDDRLTTGPHIALSFMRVNGYSAELERTYFVESPTKEMRDMFATMMEARSRALALLKPGAHCEDIDVAANGFLRDEGLGDFLMHRTGHGIGLGNHEAPYLAEGSDDVLEANMLISIEPGIYIPYLGAFRHSDTYLITKDGYENLTPYVDDIESLTILERKALTRLRGNIVRRLAGVK